ncbi:MAG: 50S ribosomal protein L35 [Actinomycetia bacterium]|nr:50S ribosomal protein L35 [Actinomycetes bacterium]
MPKIKTHKGTAKRVKVTGSGKLMRGKAFKSHILTKKSPKRLRGFRQETLVSEADTPMINKKLGRG